MKALNLFSFILPFLVSVVLTYFFSFPGLLAILSYLVFLGMVISVFMLAVFLKQYVASRYYSPPIIDRYAEYRVAVVIPTYNEDPKIVKDTALSAMLALKGRGDVYILDDSTDERIRREIDELTKLGVKIFRRSCRRGYKAGAINDFLRKYGKNYDLLAIFDADQRPLSAFFDEILHYFGDKRVAFVQIPQAYTELETGVAVSSYWQQQPFLRIVMRGRRHSAFSLGSGTVFRIKALEEIGGLDEENITEDVSTSVDLHSRGYKSVYIDKPLIWYGEPPKDLKAYLVQQSRWSLGSFQLLPKLLRSDLNFNAFIDYIAGWMYWFKEGPLTIFEFMAPVFFLLLDRPFIKIDAILYLLTYMPFFLSALIVFIFISREFYGLRGYIYHQTIELLAFPAITASFIAWMFRRKKPFAVTPKRAEKVPVVVILPYLAILIILVASAVKGILNLLNFEITGFWFATLINVFWATYFIPFLGFGIYVVFKYYGRLPEVKMIERVTCK